MLDNPIPLAEKLRPQTLDELVGQDHLKNILKRAINSGAVPSMILWGPPGVGKTTIANIIANSAKMPFFTLSAISAGVKDIRDVIQKSRLGSKSILFIDEIHRFNKGQQDALLGAVEKGQVSLIGATTENPSFEVNAALLSRCQVYTLNALAKENLNDLIDKAINHPDIFKDKKIEIKEDQALMRLSGGDGRKLLNLLELVVDSLGKKAIVTNDVVTEIAQKKAAIYDKSGEMHYDIISAFIKSIRGSDPNAAVYYLARMIEGGEDVKFIARRLLILASEDIGNANPTALVIANNAFQAVNVIGYPESRIILSQCVTYLACSAKSNASYVAIKDAQRLVQETGDLSIPLGIRNAPTKLMKEIGYGQGYQYAHDHSGNFVDYEFMPEELKGKVLFKPGKNPREEEMRKKLKAQWKDKYGY
ncbi:MAG: replication-associated recombination protein A [Reichenbachiella sp.]|uniref:replication-associated recombination protein A n=1 Tax=Reichenbachiella sp. TaxID=2184521 RepID=UPI003267BD59